ncbi:hypothetical protein KSB_62030 [Ktedonobacter robiniae]|uniref:Uncharacterized protein n=1 Tax=Ktedonobacter robiniae TaxID=2778365 RepID=A0ABQ3UYG7_9CHLR|nr:hypothetical protein KSB_62030 [Ktedonobacter robiniae]
MILVTQYLSAGNGINLQYLPTPESTDEDRRDFTVIGLLERPYYYFSKPSDDATTDEQAAAQKKNIWYLAKLYFSKALFLSSITGFRATTYSCASRSRHPV